MKNKMKFIFAGISVLLTAVLIVLVRLVDVAPIGPEGTSIGLSHLNQAVHDLSGVNIFWYDITEWFGIVAILIAGLFALTGLVQLVKGRSIRNVDKEILALGALYMVVIGLYGLFEIVIVNYRPVIMPDEVHPEASFPSSHTMLVCVVLGSAMMLMDHFIKKEMLCKVLRIVCAIMIGMTVIGRLLSGVHWFTDIIGGVLISSALLLLFSGIMEYISTDHKADE